MAVISYKILMQHCLLSVYKVMMDSFSRLTMAMSVETDTIVALVQIHSYYILYMHSHHHHNYNSYHNISVVQMCSSGGKIVTLDLL